MNRIRAFFLLTVGGLVLTIYAPAARAQLLDTIDVTAESGNRARVEFHFNAPTQLVRYFPQSRGKTLYISFKSTDTENALASPGSVSFDRLGGRLPLIKVDVELNGTQGDRMILRFNRVVSYTVQPGGDGRTIIVHVALPPRPVPPKVSATKIEQDMAKARRLLIAGKNKEAVAIFSRIAALPENPQSQVATELLGLAYERQGNTRRAVRQYRLYLQKYPKGDGADRVRQRLRTLLQAGGGRLKRVARKAGRSRTAVYGTWSQRFYTGVTKTAGGTSTDQEALVTDLNMSIRHRSGKMEYRGVLGADHTYDFLNNLSEGRVRRAYVRAQYDWHKLSLQLGRQPARGGGILGYYDGVLAGGNITDKWRLNYVTGTPFDTIAPGSRRQFSGYRVDAGQFAGHWSGSLFSITNTIDGLTDRDAVGGEFRYSAPSQNVLGLFDYDRLFAEPNIFLLQGYWQIGKNWSYYASVDVRKAPLLQLNNSLLAPIFGTTYRSMSAAIAANPGLDFMQLARDRTGQSRVASTGATHTFSNHLQLGADLSYSNFSGLPASAGEPAVAENTTITATGRVVSTELFHKGEVSVLGISVFSGSSYKAFAAFLTDRGRFVQKWQVDAGLKTYVQYNDSGTDLTRFTPSVRVQYSRKKATFEFEIGHEHSDSVNPLIKETTDRDYVTLGYRYDF
ncbi:MAG: tetratricopeptide repeat protein [Acidiferrobacteraceae bacterium]